MTKVYAHRGYSGIFPENTLQAFLEAAKLGVDGIECDVHLSKTGDLVVIHDETVDRTTEGSGEVANMRRDDITALKTVPFLEDLIRTIKVKELNIELKTDINPYPGIETRVLEMLAQLNPSQRIILSSFNIDTLKCLRSLDETIPLALIAHDYLPDEIEIIETLALDAIHYEQSVVLQNKTRVSKDIIRVWTVNDVVYFKTLWHMGVGAIMTDYPVLKTNIM